MAAMLSLTGCSFGGRTNSAVSSTSKDNVNFDADNYAFILNSDKQSYSVMMGVKAPIGELHIPATYRKLPITSIKKRGFVNCNELTSLVFHGNVTTLEEECFSSCYELRNITFCNSISVIGEGAFAGDALIEHVDMFDGDLEEWKNDVLIASNNDFLIMALDTDEIGELPDHIESGRYMVYFNLGRLSESIDYSYLSPFLTGGFVNWNTSLDNAVEMHKEKGSSTRYYAYIELDSERYQTDSLYCQYQLTLGYNGTVSVPNAGVNWSYKSYECQMANGNSGLENPTFSFVNGSISLGTHTWYGVPKDPSSLVRNDIYLCFQFASNVPDYIDLYLVGEYISWDFSEATLMYQENNRIFFVQHVDSIMVGEYSYCLVAQYAEEENNWEHAIMSERFYLYPNIMSGSGYNLGSEAYDNGYISEPVLNIDWANWMPPRS